MTQLPADPSLVLGGMVAVVTGGASGIGEAISRRLRLAGVTVVVFDRAIDELGADDAFAVDIADESTIQAAVGVLEQRFDRIDILVNNAGIGAQGTVADSDDEEWLRVLNVNVVGTARVSRALLPLLRRSSFPSIVNIASIAATAGLPQRAVYSASKGAVLSLTRAMAADHLSEGIRVNAVSPGTADTPWVSRLLDASADPAAERDALAARQPHGRLVKAEEIAEAVAYLVSPAAGSTTGTNLAVDGGMQELRLRAPSAPK